MRIRRSNRLIMAGLGLVLLGSGCATRIERPADQVPVPALGDSTWTSWDGKELPYRRWQADGAQPPSVVVIGTHGLSGASSDFGPLGERAVRSGGPAVYAPDLRGQGNDPDASRRGDIESRSIWIRDLATFHRLVAAEHPGSPIVWFGESMGALLVLEAAVAGSVGRSGDEGAAVPSGLILASPPVALRQGVVPGWKIRLLRAASVLAPWVKVSIGDIAGDDAVEQVRVTSETTHAGRMAVTPHYVERFTLRLLGEIDRMARSSEKNASAFDEGPVLVLYTPNDAFTPPEAIERFAAELGTPDRRSVLFPRSYHLILHDVERERALDVIDEWLVSRLPPAGK